MRGIFTFLLLSFCAIVFGQGTQVTSQIGIATQGTTGTTFTVTSTNTLPQRLQLSDNITATASNIPASGSTTLINISGFNFSDIPDNAILGGISIRIEGESQSNRVRASLVQLTQNGTLIGTNQATTATFANNENTAFNIYGGNNNKFNTTLTIADIKNANFGIALRFLNTATNQTADLLLDQVTVTVFYNQRPTAVNETIVAPSTHASVTGDVTTNDTDPQNSESGFSVELVGDAPAGSFNLNSNGTFSYTPLNSFTGGEVTFQYQIVSDGGLPALGSSNFATVTLIFPEGGTLPVAFISLDAAKADNGVLTTWKVGTENNVKHYEVERSSNGNSYSKIGTVKATGSNQYTFTDVQSVSGTVYYRVRNVDNDGTFKYSTVVSYANGRSSVQTKAFPTVTKGMVTLQHARISTNTAITINNMEGRTLRSIVPAHGATTTPIDLGGYPTGSYVIRFQSEGGTTETFRIVKQ